MLGLLPETVYHHHVREGVATAVRLCVVLLLVVAWQLGHLATLAPALAGGAVIAVLTPTVLMFAAATGTSQPAHSCSPSCWACSPRRFIATETRVTIAFVVSPTPAAMADSAPQPHVRSRRRPSARLC